MQIEKHANSNRLKNQSRAHRRNIKKFDFKFFVESHYARLLSRGDRFAIALLATLVRPLIERCSPLPLALDRFATETLAALVFSAHMSLMRGIGRWGDFLP